MQTGHRLSTYYLGDPPFDIGDPDGCVLQNRKQICLHEVLDMTWRENRSRGRNDVVLTIMNKTLCGSCTTAWICMSHFVWLSLAAAMRLYASSSDIRPRSRSERFNPNFLEQTLAQ